jgi:hypothetical protein
MDQLEAWFAGCELSERARDPKITDMSQERHAQNALRTSARDGVPPEIAFTEEDRAALEQAVLALEGRAM